MNKLYLVLEYCKSGDLISLLEKRQKTEGEAELDANGKPKLTPMQDSQLWNIFRQVAAGIRYLHYQNVVHGDIKPQV